MSQYTRYLTKRAIIVLFDARKNRLAHPDGKFDNAGRWYPSEREDADDFTLTARSPSRAWPHSYIKAARTRRHIKALAEIDIDFVLDQASAVSPGFKAEVAEARMLAAKAAQRRAEKRARDLAKLDDLVLACDAAFGA